MSFATDQILGMLGDIRQHRMAQECDHVLGEYQDAISNLTQRHLQSQTDKRALLQTHLHAIAMMAGMQAEIETLRHALRELKPDHPALHNGRIDATVSAPAREKAYTAFHDKADEFNAWLIR